MEVDSSGSDVDNAVNFQNDLPNHSSVSNGCFVQSFCFFLYSIYTILF